MMSANSGCGRVARIADITAIDRAVEKGEVLTDLFYFSPEAEDLYANLNAYRAPFNKLGEKELCPGAGMLEKISAALR